jgi:hypothetical protein
MQVSEALKVRASNTLILSGPICDLSHSEKKWTTMLNHAKPYEKLIKKCWTDESFKQRLLADPMTVMQEEGLPIPPGVTSVAAIENGPAQMTIVIPPNPADLPESVSDLVAGGYFIFSRGGFSFDFVIHNR